MEVLLLLLLLRFSPQADAIECSEKEYLDVGQCKALPSNFTLLFNATEYYIVKEVDQPIPPDTYLFGVKLYINNNTLPDEFPLNSVVVTINDAIKFQFEGGQSVADADLDVTVLNTLEYGVTTAAESSLFKKLDFGVHETSITTSLLFLFDSLPTASVSVNVTKHTIVYYDCTGSECLNGGTCIPGENDNFDCSCSEGFFGNICEYNPCKPDPCDNGNCSIIILGTDNNYTCQCYTGYTGQNCSINIDDCNNIDCGNGTCTDLVNGYQCECSVGFTGETCMINIDDCDPNPCVNGTCNDLVNDYQCDCYLDWEGKNCSSEINLCAVSPLNPNFPCDLVGYADCTDGNNTYTCECRAGYTGTDCGADIDECATDPCLNGVCTDLINAYSCKCYPGWQGDNCEKGYANCTDGNDTYICECKPGYTGTYCEIDIAAMSVAVHHGSSSSTTTSAPTNYLISLSSSTASVSTNLIIFSSSATTSAPTNYLISLSSSTASISTNLIIFSSSATNSALTITIIGDTSNSFPTAVAIGAVCGILATTLVITIVILLVCLRYRSSKKEEAYEETTHIYDVINEHETQRIELQPCEPYSLHRPPIAPQLNGQSSTDDIEMQPCEPYSLHTPNIVTN